MPGAIVPARLHPWNVLNPLAEDEDRRRSNGILAITLGDGRDMVGCYHSFAYADSFSTVSLGKWTVFHAAPRTDRK